MSGEFDSKGYQGGQALAGLLAPVKTSALVVAELEQPIGAAGGVGDASTTPAAAVYHEDPCKE